MKVLTSEYLAVADRRLATADTSVGAIQRLQAADEQADYDALEVSVEDSQQAIDIVARFVAEVVDALAGEPR